MYGFDPIYLLIFIVGALLSGITAAWVKKAFARASQLPIRRGLSGAEVAWAILRSEGITDVEVVEHQGFLSDHYNPLQKTLALSPDVYHGRHAAAAGVAAHEVGHAIQHARGYAPLGLRSVLVPAANIGSGLGPWLIIIGAMLAAFSGNEPGDSVLAWIGLGLFAAASLFALITLPVEFDASSRAKTILAHTGITLPGEEQEEVGRVLNAAGMTYVAAAAISLMHLLYFASILMGGRRE